MLSFIYIDGNDYNDIKLTTSFVSEINAQTKSVDEFLIAFNISAVKKIAEINSRKSLSKEETIFRDDLEFLVEVVLEKQFYSDKYTRKEDNELDKLYNRREKLFIHIKKIISEKL
jgi:hypothetical protein